MPVPGELPGDVPDVDEVEFSFSCWRRILAGGNAGEMMRGSTGLASDLFLQTSPSKETWRRADSRDRSRARGLDIDIDTGSVQRWCMTVARQRN